MNTFIKICNLRIKQVIKISSKTSVKTILMTNPVILNSNSQKVNMGNSFGVQKQT